MLMVLPRMFFVVLNIGFEENMLVMGIRDLKKAGAFFEKVLLPSKAW